MTLSDVRKKKTPAIVTLIGLALSGVVWPVLAVASETNKRITTLETQQVYDKEFREGAEKQLQHLNAQQATTNEKLNWVVRALSNNGVQP